MKTFRWTPSFLIKSEFTNFQVKKRIKSKIGKNCRNMMENYLNIVFSFVLYNKKIYKN